MRELRTELETRAEELNLAGAENSRLQSQLETNLQNLQSLELRYRTLAEQSSAADLIQERDQLKEKNDKLKVVHGIQ